MLTLNDGRSELWQWDTGRKLTVDADCSQVHFSNKVFGRSIDVDVMDGLAIIPDILLQTDKDLNVWAFVGTAENGYTKISKTFKVNRRNKPADYVFTPPDQTSLEEIKEKVEYLESVQDPDAIKNAVEDYLEQNPVEAPVKSVNGQTGEVKLTAGDVGAISQDDLQEATNEALAQAKASGEFDGADGKDGKDGADGYTPVKGVDYFDGKDGADGQPGEKGDPGDDYVLTDADKQEIAELTAPLVDVPQGGGGEAEFTEAFRITTTEAVKTIETGIDLHNYSEMLTLCKTVSSDGATASHFVWYPTLAGWNQISAIHGTQQRVMLCHGKKIQGERWLFEGGYCVSSASLFDTEGTPNSDRCYVTTDGFKNAEFVKNHLVDNWKFGAYQYANVDMAIGTEAIVFVR